MTNLPIDIDAFAAATLTSDPFPYLMVPNFVRREAMTAINADYPLVTHPGSFPLPTLQYGPAFRLFMEAIQGPDFTRAVEAKFGLDLSARPTMVTARGQSAVRDGQIHTDSRTKLITVLIYMNPDWRDPAGRLRLLRRPDDLEDYAVEVSPLAGTMVAFRRSARSFHGHCAHLGERRSIQLNWVTDAGVVRRELGRHRWSARLKALNPRRWRS